MGLGVALAISTFQAIIVWEAEPSISWQQHGGQGLVDGWAVPIQGVCVIHARKPKGADDGYWLRVLGHEVLHCTDGDYHGSDER